MPIENNTNPKGQRSFDIETLEKWAKLGEEFYDNIEMVGDIGDGILGKFISPKNKFLLKFPYEKISETSFELQPEKHLIDKIKLLESDFNALYEHHFETLTLIQEYLTLKIEEQNNWTWNITQKVRE